MTTTPAVRTAQTIVETRRAWEAKTQPERRRDVLELMQRRNDVVLSDDGRPKYPAREAFTDLLIAFMTHKAKNPSPHTERNYRRAVHNLFAHWANRDVRANDKHVSTWERPGIDGCNAYKTHLQDPREAGGRALSAGSARIELAAVSRFYDALFWCTFVDSNPWEQSERPKITTAAADQWQAYTAADVDALREKAEQLRDDAQTAGKHSQAAQHHVDLLIVLLGAHAGLRAAEMVGIRWQDVQLGSQPNLTVPGTIERNGKTVRVAKRSRQRDVKLSPALVAALEPIQRDDGEVLPFTTTARLYRRLERLAKRAGLGKGIVGKGLHGLRHTCCTTMYEETGDIELVRQHLGHASVSTTQRYVKPNDERLRNAVAAWT